MFLIKLTNAINVPETQGVKMHANQTSATGNVQHPHIGTVLLRDEGSQALSQTALALSLQVFDIVVIL